MSRNRFLKAAVDVAGGLLAATDTLQPLPEVQIGGVVPFAVHIGVKQSPFSEVELGGRGDRIDALSRYVVVEWLSRLDGAVVDFVAVLFRTGIDGDREGVAHLHGGIVSHDLAASVELAGQGGGVEQGHSPVGKFERRLQHVGHGASVAEEIDPS